MLQVKDDSLNLSFLIKNKAEQKAYSICPKKTLM